VRQRQHFVVLSCPFSVPHRPMRPAAPRGFVDKSVAERVSDEDDELVPPLSEVVDTVLTDAVEHQRPLQADRLPDADFFNGE
jgi:hypothetical protein